MVMAIVDGCEDDGDLMIMMMGMMVIMVGDLRKPAYLG